MQELERQREQTMEDAKRVDDDTPFKFSESQSCNRRESLQTIPSLDCIENWSNQDPIDYAAFQAKDSSKREEKNLGEIRDSLSIERTKRSSYTPVSRATTITPDSSKRVRSRLRGSLNHNMAALTSPQQTHMHPTSRAQTSIGFRKSYPVNSPSLTEESQQAGITLHSSSPNASHDQQLLIKHQDAFYDRLFREYTGPNYKAQAMLSSSHRKKFSLRGTWEYWEEYVKKYKNHKQHHPSPQVASNESAKKNTSSHSDP